MELWLSDLMLVGPLYFSPTSSRILLNQINSQVALVKALHSASMDDKEIVDCFLIWSLILNWMHIQRLIFYHQDFQPNLNQKNLPTQYQIHQYTKYQNKVFLQISKDFLCCFPMDFTMLSHKLTKDADIICYIWPSSGEVVQTYHQLTIQSSIHFFRSIIIIQLGILFQRNRH